MELLLLIAIQQENKEKVRPMIDYRELNQFVSSHTAEGEVCQEILQNGGGWQRKQSYCTTGRPICSCAFTKVCGNSK